MSKTLTDKNKIMLDSFINQYGIKYKLKNRNLKPN